VTLCSSLAGGEGSMNCRQKTSRLVRLASSFLRPDSSGRVTPAGPSVAHGVDVLTRFES